MTFQIIKKNNDIIYQYEFNNLNELLNYINNTPVNSNSFTSLVSHRIDDNKFFCTKNYEEAYDLCKYGMPLDEIKEFLSLNKDLETILPSVAKDRRIIENIYGMRPNIPKYLRGNPKSMYFLKRYKPTGIIDVYYNVSISGMTKLDKILNRGICAIQLVKLLESLGYIVSFNLISLSRVYNEYIYANIKIKNDFEKIDPITCYFPMCHPSFPRRIMFSLKEVTPYQNVYNHYGAEVDDKVFLDSINTTSANKIIIPKASMFNKTSIVDNFLELCKYVNIDNFINDNNKLDYDTKEKKLVIRRK